MVLVPSQSDNTPLINLIAEVSKQQKQQETLLREIEARLVNQEAQEFSARNYSQVAGQHAFSSEYLTVPQHVNLINPHLKVTQIWYWSQGTLPFNETTFFN